MTAKRTTDGIIKFAFKNTDGLSEQAVSILNSKFMHGMSDEDIELLKSSSVTDIIRGVYDEVTLRHVVVPTRTIASMAFVLWFAEYTPDSERLSPELMKAMAKILHNAISQWNKHGLGLIAYNDMVVGVDIAKLHIDKERKQ